jgi:hypothetical protein
VEEHFVLILFLLVSHDILGGGVGWGGEGFFKIKN